MNEARRECIKLVFLILGAMFVYPPWLEQGVRVVNEPHLMMVPSNTWHSSGYALIFDGPYNGRLDWIRLWVQFAVLVLFTAYLLYINGDEKKAEATKDAAVDESFKAEPAR